MTARAIVTDLLFLCLFGFAGTDFGLPPPLPPFLQTVAIPCDLRAGMQGVGRFSSDAIIFFQDANGRHPPLLNFVASAHPAASFDGRTVFFASKREAKGPQILEAGLTDGVPRCVTCRPEGCVRPFYLSDESVAYAPKTRRQTRDRSHGALDRALTEESAL